MAPAMVIKIDIMAKLIKIVIVILALKLSVSSVNCAANFSADMCVSKTQATTTTNITGKIVSVWRQVARLNQPQILKSPVQ